ncbi:MAG TPA: NAD-dependent epimerase/dehydratase family protein [Sandaracinaceae bacterium]
MKVLVLGASGFIGGAAARRLLERGDALRVLVRNDDDARAWSARGAEVARGDLGDPRSIADAARGCAAVIHAAGIVSPRAAPRALRWTHVAGTENVVNACRHAGVQRLVYVSCADVTLVASDRVHWDERQVAPTPFGERAKTLALGEEIALAACGPQLEVVALRPAWVWGPGDTSRLPWLCREALEHGGLYLCGGDNFLSAVYVENLVDAIVSALRAEDAVARVFYVADPEVLHARELFRLWSEAAGLPPPRAGAPLWLSWPLVRLRGRGPAGLSPDELLQRGRSTLFDVNAAVGKLGFDPKVTVEAGMRALRRWVEEQGGPEAVAALAAPPPDARSVDAQVAAAGGD